MKIGIFDPYLDDLGGGEKYMLSIAECLSRKHDVSIFWDNEKDLHLALKRFSIEASRIHLKDNIFSKKYGFFKRLLESKKYDIIIYLSDGSLPFVFSRKLFIHIQQPLLGVQQNSLKFKFKLLRVSKIFFNSEFSKSFVPKSISKKGTILYPPVIVYPKKLKKENIVLHVGRFRVNNVDLRNYKKQDVMIEIFKKMVDNELKNWKFVLAVGLHEKDRKEFEQMKRKAAGYPIEFMENVPNNKLWDYYSKSKIYWHASGFREDLTLHPEYAEHFGISTVEAMGAGAVPIVINAGGQREIIENGESGFLWNTEDELIEKTHQVIENQELWEKMSRAAIARSTSFSGDRFCQEVHQLIK